MTDEIYDDIAIEQAAQNQFGVKITIDEVIVRNMATGYTSTATVFTTSPPALYVLIRSQSSQTLADVKAIIRNTNLVAGTYLPPQGDKDYFKRVGIEKFKLFFPAKHIMSDDDIRYYQTLALYSPALVRIVKVKGDIRAFHFESKSWRKVKSYSFNKIPLG